MAVKIVRDLVLVSTIGAATCFAVMYLVNWISLPPTHSYSNSQCTRYCHDKGCPHFVKKYNRLQKSTIFKTAGNLYKKNIQLLKNVPGLTYKQANILIYVIVFPLVWVCSIAWILAQRRGFKKRRERMSNDR